MVRSMPHNLEVEQGLLGAILVNNLALNQVGDRLRPEHFYQPVHQKIFAAILHFHDRGQVSNPSVLRHYFEKDEALQTVGGADYLRDIAAASVIVINIHNYADVIYDLALKRQLITLGEQVVNDAYELELDKPATRQIEAAEQGLFQLSASGDTSGGFKQFRQIVQAALSKAEFAHKNKGAVIGITSGLKDLDRMLGGLQPSDLLILAGRPSMGKTALATTIAWRAAEAVVKTGGSVGFFSLEMSAEQLATRILSMESGLNSSDILRGHLAPEQFGQLISAHDKLASLPMHIDDTPALSISALRTRARRLKRTQNVELIVVDYLQLLTPARMGGNIGRVQEVSEITQGLKAVAKELSVPVIALSQLSRAVEQRPDKRPQLSDLRESGSIEQDADVVMFVYREEYYKGREQPAQGTAEHLAWQEEMEKVQGLAEVIIAKQRNGPIGNVTLRFESSFTRFDDYIADDHLPQRFE